MAFQDVIDDYSDGATGTLTDAGGDAVGYTVTGTSPTVNWMSLVGGAQVNGNGARQFVVTFDREVVGATIRFSGSDASEPYFVVVDGVTVDLNVLIAAGDVTFTQQGASTHVIRADGGINGGRYQDGSIADLRFNIPITSIGAFGSGAGFGNWDFVDVGIDDVSFDVVCFADGTKLEMQDGTLRSIETLCAGDVLRTQSDRAVLRWIGSRRISKAQLIAQPKLRPILIKKGALGPNVPETDLRVSRQHRVLVQSKIAKRMFGAYEVLIAAQRLVGLPGVEVDNSLEPVTYFHILFDKHEIVVSNGALTESFFPGQQALRSIGDDGRNEIAALFPEMLQPDFCPVPAYMMPGGGKRVRRLIHRHEKNKRPLVAA